MDNKSPNTNLVLDENGVCNNCNNYESFVIKNIVGQTLSERVKKLYLLVEKIKKAGSNNQYDCILGISGGMDSSYLALRAKQLGLRPLVVHFDNGWNSKIAVSNINKVIKCLGYDLHTYVINWEEFKDLQLSYIKASVVDIEIPTDHFIYATLYEIAYENGIKYILDGNNVETEFWGGSWKWSFDKLDLENIHNIHRMFGTKKLTKYPKLGRFQRYFYNSIVGIETAYILNYTPYNRNQVINELKKEFDWHDPGGKHYESIFTRFYQGYILPKKFKIDKRKAHLSNLIWSGQLNREEALEILNQPTYDDEKQFEDKQYFLKKLGISEEEFEKILKSPEIPHEFYGTDKKKERSFKLYVRIAESFTGRIILYALRRLKIIKNLHSIK